MLWLVAFISIFPARRSTTRPQCWAKRSGSAPAGVAARARGTAGVRARLCERCLQWTGGGQQVRVAQEDGGGFARWAGTSRQIRFAHENARGKSKCHSNVGRSNRRVAYKTFAFPFYLSRCLCVGSHIGYAAIGLCWGRWDPTNYSCCGKWWLSGVGNWCADSWAGTEQTETFALLSSLSVETSQSKPRVSLNLSRPHPLETLHHPETHTNEHLLKTLLHDPRSPIHSILICSRSLSRFVNPEVENNRNGSVPQIVQ